MKRLQQSEKLLLEEVAHAGNTVSKAMRELSAGELIALIRNQLGMSQQELSKRSGVPQATISLVERSERETSIKTLKKLSAALQCKLIVLPLPKGSIDSIRRTQARKVAEKKVRYLQGTMSLEAQEPDSRLVEGLIEKEIEELLKNGNGEIWKE